MRRASLWVALAAATAAFVTAAHAGPDDYVHTPAVEYGERELELRLGTATKSGEARQSAAALAFGYGATPWWFTEVYAKFERGGGEGTRFDAFEWENRFQLTEPGQYFADLGRREAVVANDEQKLGFSRAGCRGDGQQNSEQSGSQEHRCTPGMISKCE
jgi:hypothetical protein